MKMVKRNKEHDDYGQSHRFLNDVSVLFFNRKNLPFTHIAAYDKQKDLLYHALLLVCEFRDEAIFYHIIALLYKGGAVFMDSINIIGFIISTISLKIVKNNARLMVWEGKGRYAKILG